MQHHAHPATALKKRAELDTARSLTFLHQQRADLAKQGLDRDKSAADALAAWCQVLLSAPRFLYIE